MGGDPVTRNPIARWAADDAGRTRPPDVAVFQYRAMNAGGTFFAVIGFSTILGALICLPGTDGAGHVILPLVGSVLAIAGWLAVGVSAVRARWLSPTCWCGT